MRSLLRFLIRYHTIFLFLILEIFAIILVAQFSSYQRLQIYKLKHKVVGVIEKRYDNLAVYFRLAKENKELSEENARLYNMLPASFYNPLAEVRTDSIFRRKYEFMSARVINNSINKQYNFLIIDKGTKHGVEPEMAVICKDGIVGIVKESTPNFSSVISVLNREFSVISQIRSNGSFGTLEWPGRHYKKAILQDIPTHVEVQIGDTIVTYYESGHFPPGILVGTVEDYRIDKGTFYTISVDLSTDFKRLSNVTLIKNLMHEEQLMLEENLEDD